MIISNQCAGANLELGTMPVPITVVEEGKVDVSAICPLKVGDKCLALTAHELASAKSEVLRHPRGVEADKYPTCLYTKEGLRMV